MYVMAALKQKLDIDSCLIKTVNRHSIMNLSSAKCIKFYNIFQNNFVCKANMKIYKNYMQI